MAELKNIRMEHYCREYIRTGGNGAESYRRINARFPWKWCGGVTNPHSFRVMACYWQKRPEIQRRQKELAEIMAKKSDITIDKVLSDIQMALNMAKDMGKPNDVINAAMSQAKLVGLLRDRIETGTVADFERMDNAELIQLIEKEVGPETALAMIKEIGLNKENAEPKKDSALSDAIPPSDAVN